MKSTIVSFYTALSKQDGEKMASICHDDIIFQDPVFGVLKGEQARNMWRMLCESQKNKSFQINLGKMECYEDTAEVRWEAKYNYGKNARRVHNKIVAHIEFKDGLIYRHHDHFHLWRWSVQAFGFKGFLFGWTPFFQKTVQNRTKKLLEKFANRYEENGLR